MYTRSDAWFLTTLLLLKNWASIKDIIMAGDMINHAIFTCEEINNALSVLTNSGFVEIDNAKQMHATEKASSLCNKAFINAGLFRKTEFVFGKLSQLPYNKPTGLIEYFSENEMKEAYDQYTKEISKK